jgi:hypothetical protein
MKQKIVYIGLDVDGMQYHGSALDKESGELLNFRCRPTLKGLLGHLAKIRNFAILIHSAPEVMLLAIDSDGDFIDEEGIAVASMLTLQRACGNGSKFNTPEANCFTTDGDAAFGD